MDFGTRLRGLREDHDLTQDDLAIVLGVTRQQIYRWEQNKQEMGAYKLVQICQRFDISADYLLGLPRGLRWPR